MVNGLLAYLFFGSTLAIAPPPQIPVWTYDPLSPSAPCPYMPECGVWRDFRQAHPWPYQTLAIAENGTEATVIVAEPPPSLTRDQLERAVRSLFGGDLASISYARWPTGVDGWLEDLVFRVRLQDAERMPVFSGETLTSRWQAPAALADRLRILHGLFYHTLDGFWVDRGGDKAPPLASFVDVRIPVSDIVGWVGEPGAIWSHIGERVAALTTQQLTAEKTPGVFRTETGIVALAVPRGVALANVEAHFRRFAIESDLVIGAVNMRKGGMLLLARARQTPLSTLPPLRFETFATFARNRAEHLAQSYERQRIFAGRILAGNYKRWDWAPILLSAQLDDTEFGTLLNLADQILKSWSEHGDVEYYAFRYPRPDEYPFGDQSASGYFARKFLTTSLLYNWNTEGFATITNVNGRDILAADRTGALAVLYRPTESLAEEVGQRELLDQRTIQEDADARAREARNYFAALGDPILIRVVQNVMLCQAVQSFAVVRDPQDQRHISRSEQVVSILEKRAATWLAEIQRGETDVDREIRTNLTTFMKTSGFTQAKMARVLASPQSVERDLHKAFLNLRTSSSETLYLFQYLLQAEEKSEELFRAACKAVNGNIRPLPGGNEKCVWKAIRQDDSGESAFDHYDTYATGLKKMQTEFEQSIGKADQQARDLKILQQTYLEAGEIAQQLSKRSGGVNLDDILAAVLEGAAAGEHRGSIKTPSVVLSQNTTDVISVGGHNIDLMPPKRYLPPTSIMPPRRPLSAGGPGPEHGVLDLPRPAQEALGAKRTGSLLAEMRSGAQRAEARPERWAELNAKAKACQCDAVVVQGEDNVVYFVRNAPPPAQGTIFGRTGIIDALAGPPVSRVVRFEGFPSATVENIARSTALVTADQRSGGLDEAFGLAWRTFQA
jgi:hypothetical protein